ncbi:putative major capsid protein [Nostoc phage A1]|uniref:Major capsid protein n=1 Tax=Nostoc phage A1 TaxID=1775256 RepID=A0ACD6B8V7_9CAUD|nr:Chain A, Putative major capsid protein [Nostoc phage A1]7F38_B Chain B, Putative major capsid protein [Nostoc phage A1]7F38_C Chain C, Putative major capsid protein [Nostoc phage A1]7F38_D Chain D, Putative major capsid protein [Nostoc phage A1]7F38_E Chain E, Putative major capsid protein [Nostoc phage A1]7F38_F Chain F, Putative major capsid protein [Nostoc phage A1]7F38_G Chain G, Putative major capsid protein [Nostoc phage A1]7F38_H Chain H, Putative major capsid protein [Nostoc phage
MPLTNLTPTELLANKAVDYLANSFLVETPMLGLLANRVINQKQKAIEWGAKVAQGVVGGRTRTGALANDTQGTIKGASLSVPDYYIKHQFDVGKDEIVNSDATGKISAVRDPVGTAIADAFDVLSKKINSVLYTASGVADATNYGIFGLDAAAGTTVANSATGTYAGISKVTFPRWRSIIQGGAVPGTNEALTIARMTAMLRARRTAGVTYKGNQNQRLVILTSDNIENDVLRPLYGTVVDNQNVDFTRLDKDLLPYVNYMVKGIPVVSDIDCPANKMYLLNLDKLAIYSFDQSDADQSNGKITYIPLRYVDETGDTPSESTLWVRLADVSDEHPDLLKFELSVALQLVAFDLIDSISVIRDITQ